MLDYDSFDTLSCCNSLLRTVKLKRLNSRIKKSYNNHIFDGKHNQIILHYSSLDGLVDGSFFGLITHKSKSTNILFEGYAWNSCILYLKSKSSRFLLVKEDCDVIRKSIQDVSVKN